MSVICPVGGYPIDKITWQKDGVRLPVKHQQDVHANGTLTISAVTRAGDEGSYSCTALDKQGRSDQQTLHIQVKVPPQLAPLTFVGGNRAGLRAQATCLVLAGDPPLSLRWYKNGQEVDAGSSDVIITHANDFSSSLSIEQTLGKHAGNYTCSATNGASTASTSAVLVVNASGSWGDISRGSNPMKTATSLYENISSGSGSSYQGSEFSPNTHQDGGHSSLVLLEARQDHGGRYLCQANNGVGAELSKLITIVVHGLAAAAKISPLLKPPTFPDSERRVEVAVGGTATFICQARGDAPLALHWLRNNSTLSSTARRVISANKYSVESSGDQGEGNGRELRLTIHRVEATDGGDYHCVATNGHGTNSALHHLLVQDVPARPLAVTVAETTSRSLTLTWQDATSPHGSDVPFTRYVVLLTSDRDTPKEVAVHSSPAKLTDLVPATRYFLRVAAENSVGRSDLTDVLTATTLDEPPTGHPRNVKVCVDFD
ncbi:hypothetical protein HAZT_HAZT005789 [Hyalella azteca]|uniref:Down syndrome cell adhesion molecule-like protein Dscam2 n=1 Tax=Hyalella azteca TaxID=294128 RepID=A0A6A0GTJ0_HYAAZ|nr:hypothetical protein HAZT_HAZT005789 [Hyalella azteca]